VPATQRIGVARVSIINDGVWVPSGATYSYGDNEIIASSGTQVRSRRFSDHFPTLTN
jgi:hypothetical protein